MFLLPFARLAIDPLVLNLIVGASSRSETELSYVRGFIVNLIVTVLGMGTYRLVQFHEVALGPWIVVAVVVAVLWLLCAKVLGATPPRALLATVLFGGYCAGVMWGVATWQAAPFAIDTLVDVQYSLPADLSWLDGDFWFQGAGEAEALEDE